MPNTHFPSQALQCAPSKPPPSKMMPSKTRNLLFLLTIFTALALTPSHAQKMPVPDPPVIGAKSYLLIDNNTGHELASLKPEIRLAPASLTKLMTAYVVFVSLREGRIHLEDQVTVSEKAWRPTHTLKTRSMLHSLVMKVLKRMQLNKQAGRSKKCPKRSFHRVSLQIE